MSQSDINRIRRFNRAVTAEVGALDHSFLGRGRPLGVARVIHGIGHFGGDIATLRDHLNVDKAVLSRTLKALEAEGLLSLESDPKDGRRRIATLTKAGQAEFTAYEALSNDQAAAMRARHPKPDVLLAAMDIVATALTRARVAMTQTAPTAPEALHCLAAYYAELEERFERGFDVSLSRDPEASAMMPPVGAFFVALSDGVPLGCCGLKGSEAEVAEIKRLWVDPSARGLGLAQDLLSACETAAAELGIKVLRLDTNSALPEAEKLYRKTGWAEIDRFNDDPYPDLFFEKVLG